ncbi:hypothetical protein B0T21DRAFT_109003 [Apiosordaria backusii]|uniref:Uncharacterized protein n=1 Tax=Apiosordaria backusii TaxID=314023 RepID=A0AA39ZSK8_9PEZI|nr:hypothetical protein B0T21DRAFT_109003 [Apiosordaria backusii]
MIEAVSEDIFRTFRFLLDVKSVGYDHVGFGVAGLSDRPMTGLNLLLPFNDYLANTDLSNLTLNITAIVFTQMRARNPADNANLTLIPGDVFADEAYIQVQWPWLTLFLVERSLLRGCLSRRSC